VSNVTPPETVGQRPASRGPLGLRLNELLFLLTLAMMWTAPLAAEEPAVKPDSEARQMVILVVGAPGAEEYGEAFTAWADRWQDAARQADAICLRIGPGGKNTDETNDAKNEADDEEAAEPAANDRDRLRGQLLAVSKSPPETVWLVLIGHGTFDGQTAKFNLRGPDVSAKELATWLEPLVVPVAVINCASSSGPFVNELSRDGRVIVTATKSGFQYNYARFGDYLSAAVVDPAADLDKDEQTSLLEAYLAASARTQEFYDQEARLATEHALLDDNGDGLGTPADFFQGFRAVRAAKDGASPDGSRAKQFVLLRRGREAEMPAEVRRRRDELELAIESLRRRKAQLTADAYYSELEPLLVEMARLYESLEPPETKKSRSPSAREAEERTGENGENGGRKKGRAADEKVEQEAAEGAEIQRSEKE
jgi:hypothetical protein